MDTEGTLELAGRVHAALEAEGLRPVVIGALALAAHGYIRGTEDVDLGIVVEPKRLKQLGETLAIRLAPVRVEVSMPDDDDPLGDVINVWGPTGDENALVQVVNFDNSPGGGFPALLRDATTSSFSFSETQEGHLISLEYLILSKLYAGGSKSRGDVEELLVRRQVDLPLLRALATKYGLQAELSRVLRESQE